MKNLFITISSLSFIACSFSFQTQAAVSLKDSEHTECASCTTDAQFYEEAKRKSNIIDRYINIMNFDSLQMKKFRASNKSNLICDPNSREPDGRGGFIQDCHWNYTYSIQEVNITSEEYNDFIDLANATNDMRQLVHQRAISIPSTVVSSGYEIIGASFVETKIINHFNESSLKQTFLEKSIVLLSAGMKIANNSNLNIVMPSLVFIFSDGSSAYAVIDFYDMDDNVHFKFTKLIDANGNQFDLGSANPFASKTYDVSNMSLSSWNAFRAALRTFGLIVPNTNNTQVPKGIVTIKDCSNSTETVCRNPL